MLKLKGCPRCQGDLYLAADTYGKYVNCLQCGFTRDLPKAPVHAETAVAAGVAEVAPPAYPAVERKAA